MVKYDNLHITMSAFAYVNTWEHNLYGSDETLNWANNVISHSFLELDNI